METFLSICIGVGLSAACGFRVFIPMLILSGASLFGNFELFESVAWLGSWPVFICLVIATVCEVLAYYIPWLDNLLDSIASPMAVIAGALVSYSVFTDMPPWAHWGLAIIAGGGSGRTGSARQCANATGFDSHHRRVRQPHRLHD